MNSILEDLWYGNIDPHEQFIDGNNTYKKALSRTVNRRNELEKLLNENQKELLAKFDNTCNELNAITEQLAFKYGFSLGVRLMKESFQ